LGLSLSEKATKAFQLPLNPLDQTITLLVLRVQSEKWSHQRVLAE